MEVSMSNRTNMELKLDRRCEIIDIVQKCLNV